MNAALWQAGWGYYLSNMVGMEGTGLTPDDLSWAREHFAHARARGRTVCRDPMRATALRCAAGDVTRSVEAAHQGPATPPDATSGCATC